MEYNIQTDIYFHLSVIFLLSSNEKCFHTFVRHCILLLPRSTRLQQKFTPRHWVCIVFDQIEMADAMHIT